MNFKKWLQEWEGAFPGDSTYYVNDPERWPVRSKWQGPGIKEPSSLKKVDRMYKLGQPTFKNIKKSESPLGNM